MTTTTVKWLKVFTLFLAIFLGSGSAIARTDFNIGQCQILLENLKAPLASIAKIREKIPYLYFTPLPSVQKSLDFDKVEVAKENYRQMLTARSTFGDEQLAQQQIIPQTNEEKIALLEVVESRSRELSESNGLIEQLKRVQQRNLVRLLSQWKPQEGGLTLDSFREIMDLNYIASNASLYSVTKIADVLHPNSAIQNIVRERWETELLKKDLIDALEDLNILSHTESKWARVKVKSKDFGYWGLNIFLNVQSFAYLHVPLFFPDFSVFQLPSVKDKMLEGINTPDPEVGYQNFSAGMNRYAAFEYYKNWVKKLYPVIIVGAIGLHTVVIKADMNHKQAEFNQTGVVTMTNLPTRDQLEVLVQQEMVKQYVIMNHADPQSDATKAFQQKIKRMKIRELDAFLKQAKASAE